MKRFISAILCLFAVTGLHAVDMNARQVRKAINDGNAAYKEKKYEQALSAYEQALEINPSNLTALFNKALATAQIADALGEAQAERRAELMAQASKDFESVAKHTSDSPSLAARANYNRGNISFKDKKYQDAVDYYKNALRLDPDDGKARRNLRIAQQNLPRQDQNKDRNQDQDKEKEKEKDKDRDKDQEQNRDENRDQDKNRQNQRQQPQKQDVNNQVADRILKRSTDKENQTRKNFTIGNPAKRSRGW